LKLPISSMRIVTSARRLFLCLVSANRSLDVTVEVSVKALIRAPNSGSPSGALGNVWGTVLGCYILGFVENF
jgi:hypothetical protein